MKKCPYCGKEITAETKVCPKCFGGIPVKQEQKSEKKEGK